MRANVFFRNAYRAKLDNLSKHVISAWKVSIIMLYGFNRILSIMRPKSRGFSYGLLEEI